MLHQTYSAFFREIKDLYTFEEIAQNFGLEIPSNSDNSLDESEAEKKQKEENKKSLENVLKRLCEKRICRHGKPKELRIDDINDDEADEFIISESASEDEEKEKKYYSFEFVGIVSYDNFIFYVYPKYIMYKGNSEEKFLRPKLTDDQTDFESKRKTLDNHFKTVMKVINEFAKDANIQPLTFINNPLKKIDPVSFMVFMLHQYFEHGLYYKEESVIETNGDGETDWDITINETTPIIRKNIPYYVELKTIQKQEASVNFIRNLHMAILSECSQRLEEMGILKYLGIAPAYFEYRRVRDLGSEDYLERIIHNELRVQNANLQKIQLYSMLHFIKENDLASRSKIISIYGTRKFDVVWEKVLKALFDDLYDNDRHYYYKKLTGAHPSLKEIEAVLEMEFNIEDSAEKAKVKISHFMGKTSTTFGKDFDLQGINKSLNVLGGYSLKPDIVTIINNKLLILDAKYYLPKVEEKQKYNKTYNSISEIPVATDVSKQFEYEMLFRRGLGDTFSDFVNMFLMPMGMELDNLERFFNTDVLKRDYLADYDYLRTGFGLPDSRMIRIITLNPDKCFTSFLKKESFLSNADESLNKQIQTELNDDQYCEQLVKAIIYTGDYTDDVNSVSIESEKEIYFEYYQCKKLFVKQNDKLVAVRNISCFSAKKEEKKYILTIHFSTTASTDDINAIEETTKWYTGNLFTLDNAKICIVPVGAQNKAAKN